MFSNSVTEHVGKVVLFTFRQHLHSRRVDVLETGDVPILFTLSDEKIGCDYWAGSKKEKKITCPAFWACTPLQQSTPRWDILCST